ncbi:MAG: hypothetical protein OXB88_07055 [Bacteriovoracales bacterium]|nr:hypothetical protein [Bacteriovoracales bacterium]
MVFMKLLSAIVQEAIGGERKPDGAWLPKVGFKYPGAISFWTECGLERYKNSGLFKWHRSVVAGEVQVTQKRISELNVLYEDKYQVIGTCKL